MTEPLPLTKDGDINTSAEFGESVIVEIQWNTDFDGREIDHTKELYPRSFYGPFVDMDEAMRWMDGYPEDTDVHEMLALPMNSVRPA